MGWANSKTGDAKEKQGNAKQSLVKEKVTEEKKNPAESPKQEQNIDTTALQKHHKKVVIHGDSQKARESEAKLVTVQNQVAVEDSVKSNHGGDAGNALSERLRNQREKRNKGKIAEPTQTGNKK